MSSHQLTLTHLLSLSLLSSSALLVSCSDSGRTISEKEAKKALEEKYFIIEKTPVEYREEDGLWFNTLTGELADGAAWVPHTGENVDDYIVEAKSDPNPSKPKPNQIGYLRYFEEGKQQGPSIKFNKGNRANVIYYYADNNLELRQRFDNKNRFTRKEYVEMTKGKADGICWRWYPNGQKHLEGQYIRHPDGRDNPAGKTLEWAPSGELLFDVDYALDGSGIETVRSVAEGFRLAYAQGNSSRLEFYPKGSNNGAPIKPQSQAETWLLERATPQEKPLEKVEKPDINQEVELPPFQPVFGTLPVDLPPSSTIPTSLSEME